ncbi:MAG: phage tail assembly chaperone [Ruminococcus sp.]
MRKLNLTDAFKMARILKTAEIKEEIVKLAKKFSGENSKELNVEEIGLEAIVTLISAAGDVKVENMIYDLLSGIKECEPAEIKNLSFDVLKADIKAIINDNNLQSFFKSASGLM